MIKREKRTFRFPWRPQDVTRYTMEGFLIKKGSFRCPYPSR
jgi:hypothetical protein